MTAPPARNPGQAPDNQVTRVARGRRPKVRVPVVEALFLRSSNTRTDGLSVTKLLFHAVSHNSDATISKTSPVTQLHVSRMLLTIRLLLRRVCCSTQSSRSKCRRSDLAVCFPLPSGRTSNHHLFGLSRRAGANRTSCCVCARTGARACLFFFLRRGSHSVEWSGRIALKKPRSSASAFLLEGRRVFFFFFLEICRMWSPRIPASWSCVHVFLERFVFFKDVLGGFAVDRLGFSSFLALLAQISALSLLVVRVLE